MTDRSSGWAMTAPLIAIVLTGMAQTASAAGTSIQQYRLNEFTGVAEDFGGLSLVPLVAVESDSADPLDVPGVAYSFGFSQRLTVEGGPDGASRDGRKYAFMIELLLFDAIDRRRFFDF